MSVQDVVAFSRYGRLMILHAPRTHFDISWWVPERPCVNFRFDPVMTELVNSLEESLDNPFVKADEKLCFTLDNQAYLAWKWARNPVLISEQIRRFKQASKLVRAGKLQVGPSLVLPDYFQTPGEAHVRNKLIGRKISMDFGAPKEQVDDDSDIFAFGAQYPQILADFSPYHMNSRGFSEEQIQHPITRWYAPNGSWVYNIAQFGGYGNGYNFGRKTEEISLQTVANYKRNYLPRHEKSGVMLGLLCGGGDHTALGPRIAEDIQAARLAFQDMDFMIGTNNDYAANLNFDPDKIPEIHGELYASGRQNILRHIDSTRIYLKQRLRRVFNLIIQTETMNSLMSIRTRRSLAHLLGALERCWVDFEVFCSHDNVSGCHVDEVSRNILNLCDGIEEELNMTMQTAMAELSGVPFQMAHRKLYGLVPTPKFGLWNPLPYERSEVAIVDLPEELQGTFRLTALVNGKESKIQRLDATRAALPVAMGSFGSAAVEIKRDTTLVPWVRPTIGTIANEHLAVRVNPNGTYDVDDIDGQRTFRGLGRLTSQGDRGDEYNRDLLDDQVNSGKVRASSRVTVDGQLVQELEIKFDFVVPQHLDALRLARIGRVTIPVVTTLKLRQGSRHLEINTRIDNRASDQLLRVEFPLGRKVDESRALSGFIVQPHPVLPPTTLDWMEHTTDLEPAFTTFSNQGMVIAGPFVSYNFGLTEYEVFDTPEGESIYTHTLQRGMGYLSRDDHRMRRPDPDSKLSGAGPELKVPDAQCLGERSFDYTLGFVGQASEIEMVQESQKWEQGFVLAPYELNTNGILDLEMNQLVFSALKKAEFEEGHVLRAWAGTKPTRLRPKSNFGAYERVTTAEEPSDKRGLSVEPYYIASWRFV